MNVVSLLKEVDQYLDTDVVVVGYFKRPRRKHSDYLFFNIENNPGVGIQAVIKKEHLGAEKYRQLTHAGISEDNLVQVRGKLTERNSDRSEFYKYELLVDAIEIVKEDLLRN